MAKAAPPRPQATSCRELLRHVLDRALSSGIEFRRVVGLCLVVTFAVGAVLAVLLLCGGAIGAVSSGGGLGGDGAVRALAGRRLS
ncbi:MAG: hypothetical protein ACRDQ5_06810 [Sciscionella sp.]